MAKNPNDIHRLKISSGKGNLGRVKNVELSWRGLKAQLREPSVDNGVTYAEYLALPVDQQSERKSAPGFLVGGPCENGKRDLAHMSKRYLLCLDIDEATAKQMAWVLKGKGVVWGFEFFAHTTRKHCQQKPRWRFLFPLKRPIDHEEFNAVERILASQMFKTPEISMDAVDDVSFRLAQVMYLPSISKGQDYEIIENAGDLLDAKKMLKAWDGDWRDFTQLPYSKKRGAKKPTDPGARAEHPHQKKGLIGAFCRAYSVEDAITKFLPDVYVEGDEHSSKPRYTYTGGSTANGAIVEDDGLFLYSHHGTDPVAERLVNSFDLVRIHLFGDKDGKVKGDKRPTEMPSYEAMVELLSDDEPTMRERQKANYDVSAMFDDLGEMEEEEDADHGQSTPSTSGDAVTKDGAETLGDGEMFGNLDDDEGVNETTKAEKPERDTSWLNLLEITEKGQVLSTVTNLALILYHDPRFRGRIRRNQFTGEVVLRKAITSKSAPIAKRKIADPVNGDLWSDADEALVRVILEAPRGAGRAGYGFKVPQRDLTDAVEVCADRNPFHPIQEFVEKIEWDGKKRIDRLFIKFLGCEDTPYTRQIARLTMIGAMCRIYEPGHKFDFAPVLEGPQGARKSTFIAVLGGGWSGELTGNLHNRQTLVENMQGHWLMEIPELNGFSRSDVNEIKSFISGVKDRVRLAYARRAKDFKRQAVFLGTTNDSEYLRDATGGRRFWPVPIEVAEIDTEKLKRQVPQLWAEALHEYRQMRAEQPYGTLPLYLTDSEAKAEAEERQEDARIEGQEDVLLQDIRAYLNRPVREVEAQPLGDSDTGFGDLDAEDSDAPLGLRCYITCRDAWVIACGRSLKEYDMRAQQVMSRALNGLAGFRKAGQIRFGGQKARFYWRNGVSLGTPWVPLDDDAIDDESRLDVDDLLALDRDDS